MSSIDHNLIERLSSLDTPAVSDALDKLGLHGTCRGIHALLPGISAAGRAFTVAYLPAGNPPGSVGDFIDEVGPDDVVVLDNRGRTDCTIWGDLLTMASVEHGVRGTFIDGVCRDVPGIAAAAYPLFSRGSFMLTGKDRVEAVGVNVPVALGEVQVRPGDYVFGDASGVIALPAERAPEVIEIAEQISERELRVAELVKSGVPLREARSCVGYHILQRGSKE